MLPFVVLTAVEQAMAQLVKVHVECVFQVREMFDVGGIVVLVRTVGRPLGHHGAEPAPVLVPAAQQALVQDQLAQRLFAEGCLLYTSDAADD